MLHYPKIPGSRNTPNERCIAFEKLDGTNLHFDWDRDFGFHAFGTRRDQYNLTPDGIAAFRARHAHLHAAPDVFHASLAQPLHHLFRTHPTYTPYPAFKAFAEFLGPQSFAGLHRETDPKQLILFDILAEGFGILGPEQFVKDFGHLPTPRVIYQGKLTGKFADDVRNGKYNVPEGVVCKGGSGGPGGDLWMAKIKTHAYMARLKQTFADNWEDYWE